MGEACRKAKFASYARKKAGAKFCAYLVAALPETELLKMILTVRPVPSLQQPGGSCGELPCSCE